MGEPSECDSLSCSDKDANSRRRCGGGGGPSEILTPKPASVEDKSLVIMDVKGSGASADLWK